MSRTWMFPRRTALITGVMLMIASTAFPTGAAPAASLENIRCASTGAYARVILELDSDARYANKRLTGPDRIFLDISNATLGRSFHDRIIPVGSEFLSQIRAAQNRPDVVRVVLDLSEAGDYSVSEMHNPFRIVIDIYGRPGTTTGLNRMTQAAPARTDPS